MVCIGRAVLIFISSAYLPEKSPSRHKKTRTLLGVLFGVFSGQPTEQHGVAERVMSFPSIPFFLSDTQFEYRHVLSSGGVTAPATMH